MKTLFVLALALLPAVLHCQLISVHVNPSANTYLMADKESESMDIQLGLNVGGSIQVYESIRAFAQLGNGLNLGFCSSTAKFHGDFTVNLKNGFNGFGFGFGPAQSNGSFMSAIRLFIGHSQSEGAILGVGGFFEIGLWKQKKERSALSTAGTSL